MNERTVEKSARTRLQHGQLCVIVLDDEKQVLDVKKRQVEAIWNGVCQRFYTHVKGKVVPIYEDEIAEWYPAHVPY